ncbi:hypothetical protein DSO57_1018691 [Entomophthora muscae]|uniref:Uncharacterized protein n=1 Tax=Entomophthora muscae TaxID=34485 RepID=A0ACC2UEZ4_9FUNG|nr:hypothetical protein DSO57_1018691 [Entomophthora muscae]
MKELRKVQLQCSSAPMQEVCASAFTQAMCLVAVNHHFTQVQLVDIRAKYAESTDSIISGLKSAVQAISIISSSPILILRVNPFTAIFHFIMKHYHAYHRVPSFFAAHKTMNPKELTTALLSAYTILKGKSSYNLHCLYNNLSLTFFEYFVSKYNIGLPGDPTKSFN